MEKFAWKVEKLLLENLSLFKELKEVFLKERDCIVNIDIESLWKIIKQKKEIGLAIALLREKFFSIFEECSVQTDTDIKSFTLAKVIKTLSVPDKIKSGFFKLKARIETEQDDIKAIAHANSQHVNSYLLVIDDVFSTIMNVTEENQYKGSGAVANCKKGNCLLRQEV